MKVLMCSKNPPKKLLGAVPPTAAHALNATAGLQWARHPAVPRWPCAWTTFACCRYAVCYRCVAPGSRKSAATAPMPLGGRPAQLAHHPTLPLPDAAVSEVTDILEKLRQSQVVRDSNPLAQSRIPRSMRSRSGSLSSVGSSQGASPFAQPPAASSPRPPPADGEPRRQTDPRAGHRAYLRPPRPTTAPAALPAAADSPPRDGELRECLWETAEGMSARANAGTKLGRRLVGLLDLNRQAAARQRTEARWGRLLAIEVAVLEAELAKVTVTR